MANNDYTNIIVTRKLSETENRGQTDHVRVAVRLEFGLGLAWGRD